MSVYWLIPAQDALQNALGAGNLRPGAYAAEVAAVSRLLEETFPRAEAVLVLQCLQGYSVHSPKRVLRVEAVEDGVSLARMVKIGPPDELARELQGWRDCARPANDRGRVFMELTAGKPAGDGVGYETLIYEDAQQTLRAAELKNLEEAVRNCCRWGQPSTGSLEGVFDQIFAELAHRLYTRSAPAALSGELAERLQTTLHKGLPSWQQPGTLVEQCRRVSLALLPGEAVEFFDPVEYLPRLFASRRHLPEVLRGPAHGDLHGRNVLVGVVEGEARFPAVFDYEEMARDSLPGWDFAKLETELKVRALQDVFAGDEIEFVKSVSEFEHRLAEQTEDRNNRTVWPRFPSPETPAERLICLMLTLRRQAKRCLETLQGRSRSWLHEYYFLLAVYGVYAGKFGNYRRRDAMAAFLCAGFAASRFAWAKSTAANEQHRAVQLAVKALADGDATVRPPPSGISHHASLAFGREWARSRRQPFVEAAVEILTELRRAYPYMLEVGQELALALLELSTLKGERTAADRAERLLCQLDEQSPTVSMQTLCRWGRLWKDLGDELFGSEADGAAEMSRKAYETALSYYRRAYDLDDNYYPGINAATLFLLTGKKAEADGLAQAIIGDLDEGRRHRGDELAWVWATLGEAHLIVGHYTEAAEYYRRAVAHPACRPHHIDAMHAQVQRILRVQPCPDVDFETVFHRPDA